MLISLIAGIPIWRKCVLCAIYAGMGPIGSANSAAGQPAISTWMRMACALPIMFTDLGQEHDQRSWKSVEEVPLGKAFPFCDSAGRPISLDIRVSSDMSIMRSV